MVLENIPQIKNLESNNFFLLAGPCVIENEETPFEIANKIKNICEKLKIPFIFKLCSYFIFY
jgi:2-dehydro-3-deoxyphosphooctonate aldolase (KDO 8-P synthase)